MAAAAFGPAAVALVRAGALAAAEPAGVVTTTCVLVPKSPVTALPASPVVVLGNTPPPSVGAIVSVLVPEYPVALPRLVYTTPVSPLATLLLKTMELLDVPVVVSGLLVPMPCVVILPVSVGMVMLPVSVAVMFVLEKPVGVASVPRPGTLLVYTVITPLGLG